MKPLPHIMWSRPPEGWEGRLERLLAGRDLPVFFRADDAGVPGRAFTRMAGLFAAHQVPLSLAVVPVWVTGPRFSALLEATRGDSVFSWHQHGYAHKNHEAEGKKQEFGPSRNPVDVRRDLLRGRERLEHILGGRFSPVFTPPWNRMGFDALWLLPALGFKAVSRSRGAKPRAGSIPDLYVNWDLHTRKEPTAHEAWEALFKELEQALSRDSHLGVMLHHQRMDEGAFQFLDTLLGLAARNRMNLVSMESLI